MTIREAELYLKKELRHIYDLQESRSVARWLMQSLCGRNYFMRYDEKLRADAEEKLRAAMPRLLAGEPVQYVAGESEFYGLTLTVTPAALIPRPETEELVDKIRNSLKISDPVIFDIGTGSGAISLALKSLFPAARVYASDINSEALTLANNNASKLGLDVRFIKHDILNEPWPDIPGVDVIVSNPPYISRSESASLPAAVREYEPHSALFVKDEEPLLFYRTIAQKGLKELRPGGLLFFEIHEKHGLRMLRLLKELGFQNAEIYRDLQGKDRIVKASLASQKGDSH